MAAHSWWRLNFHDSGTAGGLHCKELIFRTVLNGPQVAVGGTASTNSVYTGDIPTYGPQNAFDGSTSTMWANAAGVLSWLAYHFLSPVSIVEVSYYGDSTQSPMTFDLQYSDDGTGWTTLWTWVNCLGRNGLGWDGYWDFPAYEFTQHNATSDSSQSPTVTSASSESGAGGGCMAYNALDMDQGANPFWLTNSIPAPGWWKIDLGAGNTKALSAYKVRVNSAAAPSQTSAPKNWTMESSNDNVSWTVVDTRINQTGWGSFEIRAYTLSSPGIAARYHRINISATSGADPTYVQFGEIWLIAGPAGSVVPAFINSATPISLTSGSLVTLPDPQCVLRKDINSLNRASLPCYYAYRR